MPSANWVVSSECESELMARHDAQFSYGESSLSGRSMLDFSDVSSASGRAAAKNVVVAAKLLSSARPRARCNAVNRPPTRARPAGPTDARHSQRARSRSHHGHRAATVKPQSLRRLIFTEKEDLPWAAQRAVDEARVLTL